MNQFLISAPYYYVYLQISLWHASLSVIYWEMWQVLKVVKTQSGPGSPPSLLSKRNQGTLSLGLKQLEYEVDHSPLPRGKVKNAWSHTSILP
jgi:hypothetical protein